MSEYRWRAFDADEQRKLIGSGMRGLDGESECPHCGQISVRWYYYDLARFPGRAELIKWCPRCTRFATWMIASCTDRFEISDPIADTPLKDLVVRKSAEAVLWKLDDKWNRGILPQDNSPKE